MVSKKRYEKKSYVRCTLGCSINGVLQWQEHRTERSEHRFDKQHGDIDVAIATEHLCLAATERNLGTCWVCNYDTDVMSRLFPSADFEAVAIIPVGHIAEDCPRTEKKRKAIEEIVEEI